MDLGQVVLVFGLGVGSALVALEVRRRRVRPPAAEPDDTARRLRRIDATEAYVAATVSWLFDRAVGNRVAPAPFDADLIGVPFGQVELRLLDEDIALRYAALCRWLWGRDGHVDPSEAAERGLAFRTQLHAHFERQRALAEAGQPAPELAPEVAGTVGQILDEVMTYRTEQVRAVPSGRS